MKGMSKGIGPLKLGVPKTMAKMGHPDAAMKKMHSPMDMYDTPAKNVGPKDAYIGPKTPATKKHKMPMNPKTGKPTFVGDGKGKM